jgi:hypothetical protein
MSYTDPSPENRDRINVIRDGEEVEVFNHVCVSRHFYVNSVNGHEEFEADIAKGDMGDGPAPEYVTERVARLISDEFRVDVADHGIDVVDIDSEDVEVL